MGFFEVLTLLGGVALFLFGMTTMGNGLEKMSGGRLEHILERLSGKAYKGVILGTVVTGLIQSSAATTVMAIGFVNAGIMRLTQAIGIVMGANIGTTVTAQILRLSDISGDNFFFRLVHPSSLSYIILVIGIVLYMFTRSGGRRADVGQVLLGLGVLFVGMETMLGVTEALADQPFFMNLFTTLSNPVLGVLVGTLVTAIIQSSSASVGILQAMSATGAVTFSAAAPIILGQNIGTCITALVSSIGANKNAKRVAAVHLYFNLIGTAIFLTGLYLIKGLLPFWDKPVDSGGIANFHLIFNLGTTMLLLPFNRLLEKLAILTLPDKPGQLRAEAAMLDDRFLSSPSLALEQSRGAVMQMMEFAKSNFEDSVLLLAGWDDKRFDRLRESEDVIDRMEVRLSHYLMGLVDRDLTTDENVIEVELLHTKGDVERIGDGAMNLAEVAQQMHNKELTFSKSAREDLAALCAAIHDILEITCKCYSDKDVVAAHHIEPLEEVIDHMNDIIRTKHIARLKQNKCNVESGALYIEVLINLERIADHCANVALQMLQSYGMSKRGMFQFDPYEYVRTLHQGNAEEYNELFDEYEKKYIPLLKQEEKKPNPQTEQ